MRSRLRLRALVIAWKAFSYSLGALVVAFVLAQAWFFAHLVYWSQTAPSSTAFMEERLEELRQKNPRARLARRPLHHVDLRPGARLELLAA